MTISLDKFNEAFALWVEITGQSMDTHSFDSTYQSYDVHVANREIEEALDLDPSLKLPLLLLSYYSRDFAKTRTCSVEDLVNNTDKVLERINRIKRLNAILNGEDVTGVIGDVRKTLEKIRIEYEIPEETLKEFVDNPDEVTFLYRDALWAMKNLTLMKFRADLTDAPDNIPHLVKSVHEFKTPSQLVKFMRNSVNCIVLGYMSSELGTGASSFAFAFRRGNEVFLLTDLTKWSHPMQETMTRKLNRHLERKEGKNRFPYYTLDEISSPVENNEIKDVVIPTANPEWFPKTLAMINQLEWFQSYWIVFMAILIKEKFYVEKFQVDEEMCTGDEIKDLLLLSTKSREKGSIIDSVHEAVEKGWCGPHPKDQFSWMFDRYRNKIREDLLYISTFSEDGLLSPSIKADVKLLTEASKTDGEEKTSTSMVAKKHTISDSIWLKSFNTGRIGTKESLVADQAFLARYNEAKMVEKAAADEFDSTYSEVFEWYKKSVEANMPTILKNIANLNMPVKKGTILCHGDDKPDSTDGNIMWIYDTVTENTAVYPCGAGCMLIEFGIRDDNKAGPLRLYKPFPGIAYRKDCYLTGKKDAQIRVEFRVETAQAIATMAGVDVDKLPELIRNWRKYEKEVGNHLINRIDPGEWAIQDPWRNGIDFTVEIWISRGAFNRLRRENDLPPLRFWKKDEKKE